MLDEAAEHGLLIDPAAQVGLLKRIARDAENHDLPVHASLTWKWWLAEFVPKRRYNHSTGSRVGVSISSAGEIREPIRFFTIVSGHCETTNSQAALARHRRFGRLPRVQKIDRNWRGDLDLGHRGPG